MLIFLTGKLNKTPEQIRPRLSEIRRKHSGLTINAAAQIYAQSHNTSIMSKLDQEDRQSLATVQAITQVNHSSISRVDKRTLNIHNSPIHNLSFGDRNTLNQNVFNLDNELSVLSELIDAEESLSSDEKSDYKSDIETIASQIGKKRPNKQILTAAWESIKVLGKIASFANSIASIGALIQHFL